MERLNFGISAGAVAAGFALASPVFAASLAFGAAIEALNFRALRSAAARACSPATSTMGKTVGGGLRPALRFPGGRDLAGAQRRVRTRSGLVIGLSTTIPAVVIGASCSDRRSSTELEPGPPPDDPSWDAWNPWLARERDPAKTRMR